MRCVDKDNEEREISDWCRAAYAAYVGVIASISPSP